MRERAARGVTGRGVTAGGGSTVVAGAGVTASGSGVEWRSEA